MQSKANFIVPAPVVESVTITMTADEAKMLHRFVTGTTSDTVVEATGLKYDDGNNDLIYGINDVLFQLYEAIGSIDALELPRAYDRW